MKLILTRHGETEENRQGIIQGHLPGKLSEKGIEQAKRVALRLKDEKIDVIYSSDLARTADTTKEIVKFHPDVPVHYVKELRERYIGKFQGMSKSELRLTKGDSVTSLESEGIESHEEMYERARTFLYKILEENKNKTVLFAGHNGINKAIYCVITGKTPKDINTIKNFSNTSITILDIGEKRNHRINLLDCTRHLA